jgi:tetratricopeptide (TPR) repeat protein
MDIQTKHSALQLKPRYARGWLNLGIAHANLGQHEAASRAYLHALGLSPSAGHIWNYLRMTLGNLGRYDLVQLASQQKLEPFRAHFPDIPNDDPTALLPETTTTTTTTTLGPASTLREGEGGEAAVGRPVTGDGAGGSGVGGGAGEGTGAASP